ncbi:MAG: hypothetical protein KFB97_09790 [Cyanobium sp. M30B3]|nr:MAG: hypothetical protein KFB97_09790 [Cyanobium sp. M30B3]
MRTLLLCGAGLGAIVIGTAQPANALVSFNIEEFADRVTITASGSLDLPQSFGGTPVGSPISGGFPAPGINPSTANLSSGPFTGEFFQYRLLGPSSFAGSMTTNQLATGFSLSNTPFNFFGGGVGAAATSPRIQIATSYSSGDPFSFSADFEGSTLADFGLASSSGLIGTWTLAPRTGTDPYTADDTITFTVTPVPGPLPLLGAGAAFGFSRRLRRKTSQLG